MSSYGGIDLGEVLKNDITEYIHPARVQVLPNGIPDDAKAFCRGNRIVAHGQPVTVLFLSNLVPTKGVLDFLKMAKAVIAQEENVRFVMAGRPVSPEFAEVLRSYIVSNNLQEHIRTVGPVYGEEKNHLFKQADIFVFPSHKETFPLVNLEAMQWAVPVVSTDVGAIREAVIDGENGYLVAVGDLSALVDRVLCLIRRPELRQMMGQRGRERFVVEYSQTAFERKVGAVVGCLIEMDG
jgi:glycosyltransferase involved in cell wall biosynthesis